MTSAHKQRSVSTASMHSRANSSLLAENVDSVAHMVPSALEG